MDDLYAVMGVSRSATQDEISYAYRRLAKKHHPDANSQGSRERFVEINNAYEILGDVEKRKEYDKQIGRTSRKSPETVAQTEVSKFIAKYNTVQFDELSTEEIREDISTFHSEIESLANKNRIDNIDKTALSSVFASLILEKCDVMMSMVISTLFEDPVILEKGFSSAQKATGIKSWAESILEDVLQNITKLDLSPETEEKVENKRDYFEELVQSANKQIENDGGNCFIATEIYGSYSHPKVVTLRVFRDECLMKTVLGDFAVQLYYETSKRLLKTPVRLLLSNRMTRALLDFFVYFVRSNK